jgi:tetratricopeptide (TPR) repeat protein
LAVAVTGAFFFFIWAIMHEGDEENPLVAAGIGASLILGCAVLVREVFLKKTRQRYLSVERGLEHTLSQIPLPSRATTDSQKLSLEKNAEIIKEIKRKSESARSLGSLSNGHLEVIESCTDYLTIVEKQMEAVGTGSPRLAGLRRGREIVGELHHFHLLTWAELESRAWSQKARNYATISEKLNAAQEALDILSSALQFYPSEPRLIESESAIKFFIASIKVSHWIEQAERAAFKGNAKRAISLYRDALFFLAREDVLTEEREAIAEKINSEIELLRGLTEKKKEIKLKGIKRERK